MPQISTGWWIDRFGIHPLNTEEIDDGKWYCTAAPLFSPDRGSRWIQTGRSQNRTQKDPNLEVLNLDLCPNHAKSSNRPSEVLDFLFKFGQWRLLRFCLDSCCKWLPFCQPLSINCWWFEIYRSMLFHPSLGAWSPIDWYVWQQSWDF